VVFALKSQLVYHIHSLYIMIHKSRKD